MKRFIKSLVLVAFFIGTAIPAWSQASTQGKEFWVSSTLVCSPGGSGKKATPYIAVSAENECTVTIQGGVGNAINITQKVGAGSWSEFGNGSTSQTDPTVGPVKVPMDASKWYPVATSDANQVHTLSGQTNNYGLHITATANISVYVILSAENSMDASNILPVTAIGTEYYIQDYKPEANSFDNTVNMTTILATENGTLLEITPNGDTDDGHLSGQTFYVRNLNAGQTYYMMSKPGQQLTGSHIVASKKVAVFTGSALTRVPNGRAARDCVFEQPMPIEYWGTQFIATRSLEKDGNLIGITAVHNGTELKVDGYSQAVINEGETYYLMLQNASNPWATSGTITSSVDQVITADAIYIETSCPCAVYNYDTGRDFKGSAGSEVNGKHGDPSSVWVSPIQQKIGKITFGTCYTNMTKDHFLNVVTETATCQNTRLEAIYGTSTLDKTNLLTWTPVPGNSKYSFARAKIGDSGTAQYSVFRLENSKGFIATVYGNGEDESYAYSAGSSAVEMGVGVNGETFTTGSISDSKFCFDEEVEFDANVGANEITRVDWNFGDGVSVPRGEPKMYHTYNSPGWYDVTATLYGHQACSDRAPAGADGDMLLGTVFFSFRVVRPDTIFVDPTLPIHITPEEYATDPAKYDLLIEEGVDSLIDDRVHCYDPVKYQRQTYCLDTRYEYDKEDYDSSMVNGRWYYDSQDVEYVIPNSKGCDSIITCHLKIKNCLKLDFMNEPELTHTCLGEGMSIGYTKLKGDIGEVRFVIPGVLDEIVEMGNDNTAGGTLTLPTYKIQNPGRYEAKLVVEDTWCEDKTYPITLEVYYPKDIFKYKFNNVLAVYNKDENGEYKFTAYQWYFNGTAIPGATESIYHTDGQIPTGNYFVELTDKNGMKLRSCSQDIVARNMTSQAPARKLIRNGQICIQVGDDIYDMYGQRVQ